MIGQTFWPNNKYLSANLRYLPQFVTRGVEVNSSCLGKPSTSKTDEFSEKFQTAFESPPPPSFSENHIANQKIDSKRFG